MVRPLFLTLALLALAGCGAAPSAPSPSAPERLSVGVAAVKSFEPAERPDPAPETPKEPKPPKNAIVHQTLALPMRDGTKLATEAFYRAGGKGPVILFRSPYGQMGFEQVSKPMVDRGFSVVGQATRGSRGSEGEFNLFLDDGWGLDPEGERWDGVDTLDWIVAQPWCDGRVGLWGGSALGTSALYAAAAGHPAIKAIRVDQAPWDMHRAVRPGGVFREGDIMLFANAMGASARLKALLAEGETRDEYWRSVSLEARLDRFRAPCFHVGGWHDAFAQSTIDAFRALQRNGGDGARGRQRLKMGPWGHGQFETTRQGDLDFPARSAYALDSRYQETADWFSQCFATGSGGGPAVEYYLMGSDEPGAPGNVWRQAADWPPLHENQFLWLSADGRLAGVPSGAVPGDLAYAYDPANPAPAWGGRNFLIHFGPTDQSKLGKGRPDTLAYRGEPLAEPLAIAGPVWMRLRAASDRPDTDWMAKLVDVYPDGREILILDGALRAAFREGVEQKSPPLEPGRFQDFDIFLGDTAFVFNRGHRIQATVSSAGAPRFQANPNTGDPDAKPLVATNTIRHGSPEGSRLSLPVAPPPPRQARSASARR